MADRRVYKTAPIEEAIVEFRFEPRPWNPTLPGQLLTRLDDEYSGEPREERLLSTESIGPAGETIQAATQPRVVLPNQSDSRLVTVRPDAITMNTKRPYDEWTAFRSRIEHVLDAYFAVAPTRPLTRVGVRYINHIEFEGSIDDVSTYIADLTPSMPVGQLTAFLQRCELRVSEARANIMYGSVTPQSKENYAVLLDIDVIQDEVDINDPTLTSLLSLADTLHAHEGDLFERFITAKARELFDE